MKILWLSNIILPKIAEHLSKVKVNSGGWLVGLSEDLKNYENIQLTVCFPCIKEENIIEGEVDKLQYFGFPQKQKNSSIYNKDIEQYFEQILNKVNPDIVHIFGTEYPHSLAMINVCEKLGILDKVVINIQGLVSMYSNHYNANLPNKIVNRYTFRDIIKNNNIKKQKRFL